MQPNGPATNVLSFHFPPGRAAWRVLVVGFSEQSSRFGHPYYATQQKLRNGLIRAGAAVTWWSDCNWAYQIPGLRWLGGMHAKRRLVELAEEVEPDVLILTHAHLVSDATVREIRRISPRTRMVTVFTDDISTPGAMARFSRLVALSDLSFVTTAGPRLAALAAGANGAIGFIPNPVDVTMDNVCSYLEHDHIYDVSSFGSLRAQQAQVTELRRLLPDRSLGIFPGEGQKVSLSGAALLAALGQSRIALILPLGAPMKWYAPDRVGQLFAAGCLVALPRESGLQELYGEDGVIAYQTIDELARRAGQMIDSGHWRAMARRGRDRAIEISDATLVVRYILDRVDGRPSFDWPDWTGEFYT